MDYYSNYPAPSYEECKNKLISELNNFDTLRQCHHYININDVVEQAFILTDMLDNNDCIKYSLTGWNVTGYHDILKKSFYIIDELYKKRKIRNKRLIRGLFKSTYILIKTHKESKENIYNPNSDFMKDIYSKYSKYC